MAGLMDPGPVDEEKVISSFLGPATLLRRWCWALFRFGRSHPWVGMSMRMAIKLQGNGGVGRQEVISSFWGPPHRFGGGVGPSFVGCALGSRVCLTAGQVQ